MSSLDKFRLSVIGKILLFVVITDIGLLLTGCGFTPLYGNMGQNAQVAQHFDDIDIGNIPNQPGQYLRNALIDRFYHDGRPASPHYSLTFRPIEESQTDLDITKDASSTRAQLKLATVMTLSDNATGKHLLERDIASINSFNVLQSQFDTNVAQEYARENALDDMARQVEAQLALYFKRQ